jgi:hypothetical protein
MILIISDTGPLLWKELSVSSFMASISRGMVETTKLHPLNGGVFNPALEISQPQ